jgi:preprotein translocase subunit SecG
MITLLTIVHIVICVFLVGIVLLQHGKGADIGASFGGSSQSLLGTEGPAPLLNKITTGVAICFMLTSVSLAYFSAHSGKGSIMTGAPVFVQKKAATKPAAKDTPEVQTVVPIPTASDEASPTK